MDTFSTFYASSIIHPRRQRGVGLLEVMIAVLVLGIGVLGVLGLQTVALKNSDSSSLRGQATIQVYAMFDLLRANNNKKAGAINDLSAFQTDWTPASAKRTGNADIGTLDHWLESLSKTLGSDAKGKVDCSVGQYGKRPNRDEEGKYQPFIPGNENINTKCIVGVKWNDDRAKGEVTEVTVEMEILL